ncbi:hypothetical protein ABPG72_001586 [Tetrahymena utriculariae]
MATANVLAIQECDFLNAEHHIICFSHTIHNTVQYTLSKIQLNQLIQKVQANFSWFCDSIDRLQELEIKSEEIQKSKNQKSQFIKPKLNNNTRWWSINKMLISFISYYDAIKQYYISDNDTLISKELVQSQLVILQQCLDQLTQLEVECLSLQKRDKITINKLLSIIWQFRDSIFNVKETDNPQIKDLKYKLLRPRIQKFGIYQISLRNQILIRKKMTKQKQQKYQSSGQEKPVLKQNQKETKSQTSSYIEQLYKQNHKILQGQNDSYSKQDTPEEIKLEIDKYRFYNFVKKYESPLQFNKQNQIYFPYLSKFIISLYSISPTSVVVEQQFTQMKNQITVLEAQKSNENIEQQQFVKQNIQSEYFDLNIVKNKKIEISNDKDSQFKYDLYQDSPNITCLQTLGNVGLQALTVIFYPIPDNCIQYEKDNNFNTCIQCRYGYYLNNGLCFQNCPPNTKKSINNIECVDISLCTYSKTLSSSFISQYNCGYCEKGYYDTNKSCTMIARCCIICTTCLGYVFDNNQQKKHMLIVVFVNNELIRIAQYAQKILVLNALQEIIYKMELAKATFKVYCSVCSYGSECETCSNGYYLAEDSKTCTQKCPSGYFLDKIGFKCLKCSQQNCDKCKHKSKTSCQSCVKNTILELNQCVGLCNSDSQSKCYYYCGKSCSTCSGPGSSQCIQCAADHKRYKDLCYKTCPDYTVQDENQQQCVDCYDNKNCIQCSSKEKENCKKCKESETILVKGSCLIPCQDNQFRSNIDRTCKDCPLNCVKCVLQNDSDDTENVKVKSIYIKAKVQINAQRDLNQITQIIAKIVQNQKLDQFPCQKIGYYIKDNGDNAALIIFDQSINNTDKYLTSITLVLNGKPMTYKYSLKQNSDNSIKIQLIIDKYIEENAQILQANFQNYEDQQLKTQQASTQINLVKQKEQPKYKKTDQESETSQGYSNGNKGCFTSCSCFNYTTPDNRLILNKSFSYRCFLTNLCNGICKCQYSKQPQNIFRFSERLQNPFKNYFESMNDYDKIGNKSPQKFKHKDIQGFFLENAGQYFYQFYFDSYTYIFIFDNHSYIKVLEDLKFFLQITAIEEIEYKEEIFNYIICGITLFPLLFPLALIYIIKKEKFPKIVKVVVEDLSFRYYYIVQYARKFIMSFVIVVFQFQPQVQIIILIVWHFVMALIILYKNPYEFFQSLLFLSGTSILFVFEICDLEEDRKQLVGWVTIIVFKIIMVFELGFFIKDKIFFIFELIKKIVILIKSRKNLKVLALSPQSDIVKSQPLQDQTENDKANLEDKYGIQKQPVKLRNSLLAPPSITSLLSYQDKRNLKNQYQYVAATINQIDTQRIFSSQKLSKDFSSPLNINEDKKDRNLLNIPKQKEQQQSSSIYNSSYDIQSHNNSQQVTCEVISPLPRTKRKRKQHQTFSLK